MKFGETFTEYLHGDDEWFLEKCAHVEYKRLKKVLKRCRSCRAGAMTTGEEEEEEEEEEENGASSQICLLESCSLCDQKFFSELSKEASEIAGYFSSRVRRLLNLHTSSGKQKYLLLRCCFKNDQQSMIKQGQMLIEYVTMNAIAIQKILKKYDKVHSSVTGRNFKTKMRAEHIELLRSPWLIELGAFYLNFHGTDGVPAECDHQFSCDLNESQPRMTLTLSSSVKLEYSLTCAICLDLVFDPYALSCGHIFCKSCACSAASVMIFQGLKTASPASKCPVCREAGVYTSPVHMLELSLLLKNRCKEYWKERLHTERTEMVKQSKEYWDMQAKFMLGY